MNHYLGRLILIGKLSIKFVRHSFGKDSSSNWIPLHTNFGVFVDIGIHQDGLIHISQLSNKFVSDPNAIVHLHQRVRVKVKQVDFKRNRIGLSMKNVEQ